MKTLGVLTVNTGTPAAPNARAVRRFLARFLADPRVVELPRLLWLPLLRGVILPLRAPRSARNYRRVWMDDGSPLAVYSRRLHGALEMELETQRPGAVALESAFLYSEPQLRAALQRLRAAGAESHRRAAAVPAVQRHHHRSGLRPGGRGAGRVARASRRRADRRLPRSPGLHRRARQQRARALAAARPHRAAADVLPRHPATLRAARRPVRTALPADCQPAGRRAGAGRQRLVAQLPVALRLRPLARAAHRRGAGRVAAPRRAQPDGDLPGLRGRLPRDPGGDRRRRAARSTCTPAASSSSTCRRSTIAATMRARWRAACSMPLVDPCSAVSSNSASRPPT